MENLKLYLLLAELKGMIGSLSEFAEYDDQFNYPMVEQIHSKMQEVDQEIEKSVQRNAIQAI